MGQGWSSSLFRQVGCWVLTGVLAATLGSKASANCRVLDWTVDRTVQQTFPGPVAKDLCAADRHYRSLHRVADEHPELPYQDRMVNYFQLVWPEYANKYGRAGLEEIIQNALADTKRIGISRESDVLFMAVTRLVRPDIVEDEWYWSAVQNHEQVPFEGHAGLFLAYVTYRMSAKRHEIFHAKLRYYWRIE